MSLVLLATLLGYLILGALAGTLAGLFGVGGGIVVVPVLAIAFTLQNVPEAIFMHLALGSSLATIVITGASSAWAHYRRGSVHMPWLRLLLPGLVAGAVLGVLLAGVLSSSMLETLFGGFVLVVAGKMVLGVSPPQGSQPPGPLAMRIAGGVIGSVSALFGTGGGTLSVPWLNRCGASMTLAIGTSSACGLPIALSGALTFIVLGWGHPGLPLGATGFVMWPAVISIVLTSVPFARLGVRLAHVLPGHWLRYGFALLLSVVGVRFLTG